MMRKKGKPGVARRLEAKRAQRRRRDIPYRPMPTRQDRENALNQALLLCYHGDFAAAERRLAEAKRRWPTEPRVTVLQARVRMLQDDFSPPVWEGVRWSWRTWEKGTRFREPEWDGSPMPGQTILIWGANYGYGDWLQLCRLLPAAKAQSQARLLLMPPKGLGPLLSGLADGWVDAPRSPAVHLDAQIPLNALPIVVPLTPERMGRVPYLTPDPAAVARWRPRFEDRSRLHVALHWQAERSHDTGKKRSFRLADLAPLLELDGVSFYSVQYGAEREVAAFPRVADLGRADEPGARFCQTAAILSLCDRAITCDSAVTHLAGALGVPTTLLLGDVADPQWGYDRTDSPWYPGHTIYQRQTREEIWRDEVEAVRQDLVREVHARCRAQARA